MPIALSFQTAKLRNAIALRITLFQFRRNHKFLPGQVIFNMKDIGFAADLTIFYIGLAPPRGLINRSLIALPAACALEAGFHRTILGQAKRGAKAPPDRTQILPRMRYWLFTASPTLAGELPA